MAQRSITSEPDEDLVFALSINEALNRPQPSRTEQVSRQEQITGAPIKEGRSLRGVTLFGAVFHELSAQLGAEFSSAELMKAAQLLIDVSSTEYVSNPYKDPAERAGYYTWDLVRAFERPWHVTELETYRMEHCDLEEYSRETMESARLLQLGWHERRWDF